MIMVIENTIDLGVTQSFSDGVHHIKMNLSCSSPQSGYWKRSFSIIVYTNELNQVLLLTFIQIAEFVGFILFLHLFPNYRESFTAYKYTGYVLIGLAYLLTLSFVFSMKLYGTFPVNTVLLIINAALISVGFGLLMYIKDFKWTCIILAGDLVIVCLFLVIGSTTNFLSPTLMYILTVLLAIAVVAFSVIAATGKIPWIDVKAVFSSMFLLAVMLLLIAGHDMSTEDETYALAALMIFIAYVTIYFSAYLLTLKYFKKQLHRVTNNFA
uniref:Uncharacterized protein n=1 Tax=Trichobilharzia regenti TaxID=157069 RepID=A0AA85KAX1_TRIRE|nr:unnamed protein product [Trichobilharzia regenti]